MLPVYAWAGMQLMLRLVVAIDRARRKPARRGLPLALQLALSPPAMGGIVLHVQSSDEDVELLAACEPDYPEPLREIPDPPPVLTVLGHIEALAGPGVGVVGARNASGNGRLFNVSLVFGSDGQEGSGSEPRRAASHDPSGP